MRWLVRTLLIWIACVLGATAATAATANRTSAPPQGSRPIELRVALRVLNISEVNQVAGRARMLVEITQHWTDPRNAFDPVATGAPRIDRIGAEAEDFVKTIWSPGLVVDNQIGPAQARSFAVSAFADGQVALVDRYEADFRIIPDMSAFPFDRQPLTMYFSTPRYALQDLLIVNTGIDRQFSSVADTISVINWRPMGLTFSNDETTGWNARNYSRLEATVTLDRQSGRFILRILVPIGAAMLISIFVLWLPGVSSKDKGGFVVSALLALTAISFTFENSFPGCISLNTPIAKIISMLYFYLMVILLVDSVLAGPSSNPASRIQGLATELRKQVKWSFPAIMIVLCAASLLRGLPV